MSESLEKTRSGAILFDPEVLRSVSEQSFHADGWSSVTPVSGALRSAGRGTTLYVSNDENEFVLRQYRRGGLIGRLVDRAYVWTGSDNTRSFAEWRLLAKLVAMGLPVPRPAAARFARSGPFYSAELITLRIPGIRSLADRLLATPGNADFWGRIGAGIGQFHAAGVNHADLNAYNLQLDGRDEFWLLDFDRGQISSAGPWRQKNIARLHRSLKKIKKLEPKIHFHKADWERFLEGYFSESRLA